jgi:hypothetical protein
MTWQLHALRKHTIKAPRMTTNREHEIEDAVIAHPEVLGFPGARSIRNVRVAARSGRIDVMLFPNAGPTKVALVEAKHSAGPDAASKVLGQILMYYSGALRLSSEGIDLLRAYAESHVERALSVNWISPKQLTGGVMPPAAAWEILQSGRRLVPGEVRLFVALNSQPRESLIDAVAALRHHHDLDVGLVIVENQTPRLFAQERAG